MADQKDSVLMAELNSDIANSLQAGSSHVKQEGGQQHEEQQPGKQEPKISTQGNGQIPSGGAFAEESPSSEVELATKKRKKRKKSSRKKAQPTGFEDYYVDAPLTPEEYEEERATYDQSRLFSVRIEIAIHRFSTKRRLDSLRKDVFDKYLAFGGVKIGPNMFTGMDKLTLGDSSAAQIAEMTSTSQIDHEKVDDEKKTFVVDFDGVLKGFISSRLRRPFGNGEEGSVSMYCGVLLNFLNYLAHHDVCPEFASQIQAARRTCTEGVWQLKACDEAARGMPGDFNIASSILFGGCHQDRRRSERDWYFNDAAIYGFSHETASKIFTAGFAAHGTPQQHLEYNEQVSANKVTIIKTITTGLEIIMTTPADAEVREMYAHPSMAGLKITGKLLARTWVYPDTFLEDQSPDEEKASLLETARTKQMTYEFWIEEDLIPHLFAGMKLHVDIKVTSFGLMYMDTAKGLYCSFFDVLPNEAMVGWREHVYLPPRPGTDGQANQLEEDFENQDERS